MAHIVMMQVILLFLAQLARCMDSDENSAWDGSFFDEPMTTLAVASIQACISGAVRDTQDEDHAR